MAGETVVFENRPSFAVPNEIADTYLKAPEDALRLILFLLRNSSRSFTSDDICGATGIDPESLQDAFDYWVDRKILYKVQQKYMLARPQIKASDIFPYSAAEVADEINGNSAVRFLYERAEELLARPLNTSDAYTILSLVNWIGLPPEVVAILLQYCADTGLKSMRQIEKTAIAWADGGIDTFEKAEAYIAAEKEKQDSLNRTARLLGISNRAVIGEERNTLISWRTELGYDDDIIVTAYENMIKSIGSYKYQYMDKILRSWHAAGVKTAEQALDQKPVAAVKKGGRLKKGEQTSSTDTGRTVDKTWEIMKKAVSEDDE